MINICICGYFGFNNFGDEWLLSVLYKLILQFGEKEKKIFVLYNTKKILKINDHLFYIPRLNFKEISKILKISNTLIFCGGIFQDQTSILSFLYYYTIFLLGKIFKNKIVILSTEFIVNKKFSKKMLKFLIKTADIIYVRNEIELKKIKKLNNKVEFCPDICLFSERILDDQRIDDIKTIGLVLKKDDVNKKSIVSLCKILFGKYELVFIPFHLEEDYKFCLSLVEDIKNCQIRVWDRVENYKQIFKNIDLIITSRLHGIIVAINLGIPFICFSEDKKLTNFVYNFSKEVCLLKKFNSENFNIKTKSILIPLEERLRYKEEIFKKLKLLAYHNYI
ncbi:MAG: polysaccharide pyruvyl transferase family protein [Endomicrobiia bacterium]